MFREASVFVPEFIVLRWLRWSNGFVGVVEPDQSIVFYGLESCWRSGALAAKVNGFDAEDFLGGHLYTLNVIEGRLAIWLSKIACVHKNTVCTWKHGVYVKTLYLRQNYALVNYIWPMQPMLLVYMQYAVLHAYSRLIAYVWQHPPQFEMYLVKSTSHKWII